jgi:hypothetical protein
MSDDLVYDFDHFEYCAPNKDWLIGANFKEGISDKEKTCFVETVQKATNIILSKNITCPYYPFSFGECNIEESNNYQKYYFDRVGAEFYIGIKMEDKDSSELNNEFTAAMDCLQTGSDACLTGEPSCVSELPPVLPDLPHNQCSFQDTDSLTRMVLGYLSLSVIGAIGIYKCYYYCYYPIDELEGLI